LSIILTTTKVFSIPTSTTINLSVSLTTSIIKSWCIIKFPRLLRSKVKTNQSSIQGSIGVSSVAQEAGMYVEVDIHQVKWKLLVDTGATVSIVSNDIYQKITDVARIFLLRIHSVPVLSIILTTTKVWSIPMSTTIILSISLTVAPMPGIELGPSGWKPEILAQHARNIQERETQEVDEKEVSINFTSFCKPGQ
jgi:hypothetical protein